MSAKTDTYSVRRSQSVKEDYFGGRLRDALAGRSMKWLSLQTGISTSMLSDYGRGKTPGADKAVLIAEALGVDLNWLLTGRESVSSAMSDRRLSFAGQRRWDGDVAASTAPAEAGDPVEVAEIDLRAGLEGFPEDSASAGMQQFSRAWLRHFTDSAAPDLLWARGQGGSMAPAIDENDILLIDRGQQALTMADLVWAFAFGGTGMIKRLRPMPGGNVRLLSDNPAVPPETARLEDIEIIGRVVAVAKKL